MSNNKYRILVVEDEHSINSLIEAILTANGYQAILAETGAQAQIMAASFQPDLILLDLGLPDMDGQELIRLIRNELSIPVIVVSARTDERDKVKALDLGASDYVTKPFGSAELLARIRANLRDCLRNRESGMPQEAFHAGDLGIDFGKRRVTLLEQEIPFTQTEFNILALLARHAGKVLTHETVIKTIWGNSDPGNVKKLQVNMANIRKKLGETPGATHYIFTEIGVGYRMLEEES